MGNVQDRYSWALVYVCGFEGNKQNEPALRSHQLSQRVLPWIFMPNVLIPFLKNCKYLLNAILFKPTTDNTPKCILFFESLVKESMTSW